MSKKPTIGVVSCKKPLEGETGHTVKERYIDGVTEFANAIPLIVPSLKRLEDIPAIITKLDAVLLTGSTANIEPHHYKTDDARGPWDAARDNTSFALIAAALTAGVPIFGICRGLQEINVALGGTLLDLRDTEDDVDLHHAPDNVTAATGMFEHYHSIDVAPGSRLADITGTSSLIVNSVHYQMIGQLGADLRVEATAVDGCIEAISSRDGRSIFAVQWHPEWQPQSRAHDVALWQHLGELARGTGQAL